MKFSKLKKPNFKAWSSKKKKIAAIITLGALVAGIFPFTAPGQAVIASAVKRKLPIYCVQKDSKVVSLTFDAAWGNSDTEQLIEIFKQYEIKVTFFVVGDWVDKYPESVKALYDAGHEVMNHSSNHPHMPKLSQAQMIENINCCDDKIEKITGVRPHLFRAPYGDYNDNLIATMESINHYTIQWDVDSLDWKNPGSDAIVKRVTERVQPGSIILFHNAAADTPAALPAIIEYLIKNGYSMVPVSQLILTENFAIDHTGRQIPSQNNAQ